ARVFRPERDTAMQNEIDRIIGRARAMTGSAVAIVAIVGLTAGAALMPAGPTAAAPTNPVPHGTTVATGMLPADFSGVIERVSPAVVNIQVPQKSTAGARMPQGMPRGMEECFERFFGDRMPEGFGAPQQRQQPQPR